MRTYLIKTCLRFIVLVVITAAFAMPANAEEGQGATELAKETQNPVSDLISVPFQSNFNFGVGPEEKTQYVLNIQPVLPQRISEQWNWIHRAIIPLIDQPVPVDAFGLGDIQYQGFLSPAKPDKLIWGVGPVFQFPSATDSQLGGGTDEQSKTRQQVDCSTDHRCDCRSSAGYAASP